MQICLVNFCDLSNCSTPEMLNQAPWIWDGVGGYDGPLIEPASLDIQVQEFEPLPGKEHKHILDIWCADESILVNPGFYAIPVDCLPSLDTLVDLGSGHHTKQSAGMFWIRVPWSISLSCLELLSVRKRPSSCKLVSIMLPLRFSNTIFSFYPLCLLFCFRCPLLRQPKDLHSMIDDA